MKKYEPITQREIYDLLSEEVDMGTFEEEENGSIWIRGEIRLAVFTKKLNDLFNKKCD